MSFVSFTTEAFRNNMDAADMTPAQLLEKGNTLLEKWKRTAGGAYLAPAVRRPSNGIEIKERTPVNISVLRNDGTPIMLNNMIGATTAGDYTWLGEYAGVPSTNPVTGASSNAYYTDFSVAQLSEGREERIQVMETFGDDFVFFFGERPRYLTLAGVLVNSKDFPWRAIWWENYDKYLRGTRCVENRARVYLAWDDVLVEGYIISSQCTDAATEPNSIPFSFTMLLTHHTSLTAMNLDVVAANNKDAFQSRSSEILGSLEADVRNNGQVVELDEPFFLQQVVAKLKLASVTEAYEAIRPYGVTSPADLASAVHDLSQDTSGRSVAMLGGKSLYGEAAPLDVLWGSLATTSATGERLVEGVSLDTLTSLETTRKVFGPSLEQLHSLDVL